MKTIIFAIALVGVMAVLVQINQPTVEYVREETTLEVVEPEVWMTDEDAIKAAKDVIRKKELEAERKILQSEIDKIEAEAKQKVNERQSRISEITKELTAY